MRNRFSRHSHGDANLISWRDLQGALIGMFCGIMMMMVLFLNPAMKKSDEASDKPSGNIRVEIIWPNEIDVDVDLWCKGPNDVPVGYSNKGGLVFNLVRDDLGWYNDQTNLNYEIMFSRGNPPGEYICNVHWYSNAAKVEKVPVRMVVTYRRDATNDKAAVEQVIQTNIILLRVGEEVTMARWKLDSERRIIKDSINSIQYPLRDFKPTTPPRGHQ